MTDTQHTPGRPAGGETPAGAFSGLRIVDLTDERSIYGAKLLADLGADVVRPEPPGGDPLRYVEEEGRCRIWAVGWDREDDGGKRVLNEKKPGQTRFQDLDYVGDWVWSY